MIDATPLFRIYARWRAHRLDKLAVDNTQRHLLLRLVRYAANTRLGKMHNFSNIKTVSDYQRQTPLRDYWSHWNEFWRDSFPLLQDQTWPGLIPYFALTSGTTTGASKYIPHTPKMSVAALRGMRDLLAYHVVNKPQSHLFGGHALMLTGSPDIEFLAPAVRAASVSAIVAKQTPPWFRHRLLPTPELSTIKDWEEKIRRLAPLSLSHDVRSLGGSPNWILVFLDEVQRNRPHSVGLLADWYPRLELIVHGGVNFAPYRRRFQEIMAHSHAETREVYSASEGFFAVADRGDGEGLRLLADRCVFFEFVPVTELNATNPTRHWIADVEPNIDYAVVITTGAGLWAYIVEDTVRFLSRDPPRLIVTGRTSYELSMFGEHLIEEEIAEAVACAAAAIATDIAEFTVIAMLARNGRAGGWHEYIVECDQPVTDAVKIECFCRALDERLCALNDDYRELRGNNISLRPPKVTFASPGSFLAWMKERHQIGGQNKVPRILQSRTLFNDIIHFIEARRSLGDAS